MLVLCSGPCQDRSMKALLKFSPAAGAVELRDVKEPSIADDAVLIDVAYGAVCGTDRHAIDSVGDQHTPRILGHEASGTIAALGDGVVRADLQIGTPVTFETDAVLCMQCTYCRSEQYNRCSKRTGIGTTTDGALADRIAMPERAVHALPPGVGLRAAALTEPLAVSVHAVVERSAPLAGEVVVVTGPGAVGQLTALVALAVGATPILVGRSRHRETLDRALEMGIPYVVDSERESVVELVRSLTGGLGAAAVFECSGSPEVAESALELLAKGGELIMVAFYTRNPDFDIGAVVNRELTLKGSRGKRPSSYRTALRLMGQGRIDTEAVIGRELALEDWRAGMDLVAKGVKVVFRIHD
ncbi:hypothetical protein C5B99_13925 [Pseudoclavibacter sp. Z016]|nr:hypothetical protein C5B99_13925 [Pseudoclavibacter sp. Z016]